MLSQKKKEMYFNWDFERAGSEVTGRLYTVTNRDTITTLDIAEILEKEIRQWS